MTWKNNLQGLWQSRIRVHLVCLLKNVISKITSSRYSFTRGISKNIKIEVWTLSQRKFTKLLSWTLPLLLPCWFTWSHILYINQVDYSFRVQQTIIISSYFYRFLSSKLLLQSHLNSEQSTNFHVRFTNY